MLFDFSLSLKIYQHMIKQGLKEILKNSKYYWIYKNLIYQKLFTASVSILVNGLFVDIFGIQEKPSTG